MDSISKKFLCVGPFDSKFNFVSTHRSLFLFHTDLHGQILMLNYVFFPLLSSLPPKKKLLAYFFPVVFSIPLFGRNLAQNWLWSFTPSLSYVGQGVIMGFPTAMSMSLVRKLLFNFTTEHQALNSSDFNKGMIVGWAVLSPFSKLMGWAPAPVQGQRSSLKLDRFPRS